MYGPPSEPPASAWWKRTRSATPAAAALRRAISIDGPSRSNPSTVTSGYAVAIPIAADEPGERRAEQEAVVVGQHPAGSGSATRPPWDNRAWPPG
jgi:hypothetical protein